MLARSYDVPHIAKAEGSLPDAICRSTWMPKFDDQVLAALRVTGPDAFPSSVYIEIVGDDSSLFLPSLGSVMSALVRLERQGLAVEGSVLDAEGRIRRAFTATTGRRFEAGEFAGIPRFAFA